MSDMAQIRETLGYYAKTDERVRIGYTMSNGKVNKTDPMSPYEALVTLDTLENVCEAAGLTITSLSLFRLDAVFI